MKEGADSMKSSVIDLAKHLNLQQSWPTLLIVSKIQDGSQLTGNSNISETMTYIIKIPTANLRHSTMANSQKVCL